MRGHGRSAEDSVLSGCGVRHSYKSIDTPVKPWTLYWIDKHSVKWSIEPMFLGDLGVQA